MEFYQQVTFERSPDPKRTPITPEQYEQLEATEKRHYEPEYLEFRTKKVRDYDTCYECGHSRFTGWIDTQVPIGKPYRYKPCSPITEVMMDRMLESNIIAARLLGNGLYGSSIAPDKPI